MIDSWIFIPKSQNCAYINLTMEQDYLKQIEAVCKSIQPPYTIHIDFCCLVTSKSQPEPKLMHPSVPTAINDKRWIRSIKDLDDLCEQLAAKNLYSEILLTHNHVRTNDGDGIISSQLKILAILNLYIYILLDDFD